MTLKLKVSYQSKILEDEEYYKLKRGNPFSCSSNEDKNKIPTTERYEDSDTASEKCFIQNICSKSKLFTANIIIASTLVFIHSTKSH